MVMQFADIKKETVESYDHLNPKEAWYDALILVIRSTMFLPLYPWAFFNNFHGISN